MLRANDRRETESTWTPEVDRIVRDFQRHTLDALEGTFSRLIHIASLRDYNTGQYHHYGLETRYDPMSVDQALRRCHEEVFAQLTRLSLQEQTQDLLHFFESLRSARGRLVQVWQRLKAYQILPPEKCPPLARELFNNNVEIILQMLRQTNLWELLDDPHRHADDLP
jgi:hypothetical protein